MNFKNLSKKLFDFDANYPRTIISSIIFISVVLGWNIYNLKIDPSVKSMLPKNHKIVHSMEMIDELFSGSDIVIIAVESDSLFTQKTLEKLSIFQDSLESIDAIGKVTSIFNQKDIVPESGGFRLEKILDDIPRDSISQLELIKKLKQSDIIGNLVSDDLNTLCFIGQLTSSFKYNEFYFRKQIFSLVNKFNSPENFYVASLPITRATIIENMQRDIRLFTPIALGLCILLLMITFRSWTGVFLPFSVVGFSTLWTFGVMGWLDISVAFIGTLIPVMLISIANNYGIHIISHYYEFTIQDPKANRSEIIRKTIRKVGVPIMLAGLTTVISFLSLLSNTLPRVREMSLLISFGIFVAFLLSIFLIPSILSLLPRPIFLIKKPQRSRINNALVYLVENFMNYKIPILSILIIIGIWLSLGISELKVDTNPDHYFSKNSRLRIANTKIGDAFGGSAQMHILIEGDIFSPKTLQNIETLTEHMKVKHDVITKSYSIVDVIKKMNVSFNGGNPDYNVIPDDKDLITQYMFLYSITSDGDEFDLLIDDIDEPSYTQVLLRLKEVQTFTIAEIVEDTDQFIMANFYDQPPIELTGGAALLGVLSRLVLKGQFFSLWFSVIIIFSIMAIVFRSLIGGVLAIFPMVSSVIMMFGLMGYLDIPLNMTTSMLTGILVGVGVDYTVHFLWHLRDNLNHKNSIDEAIANTMMISGKGILFNGLSVVFGFSALLFSVFVPVKIFGILVISSISFCLFGALVTLPALTSLINPKFLYK